MQLALQVCVARELVQLYHLVVIHEEKGWGKSYDSRAGLWCRRKTVNFGSVITEVGVIGQIPELTRLLVLLSSQEKKGKKERNQEAGSFLISEDDLTEQGLANYSLRDKI